MTAPDLVAEFVARSSGELVAKGFPRVPAQVMMALTASEDGRLTAAQLAESLRVSPAAVSGAVRYLQTVGFLRSAIVPGTRRHVYSLPDLPWYTATLTRPGLYLDIERVLRSFADRMPTESNARERIAEMADFFRFFEDRLPRLLDEWRQERAARASAGGVQGVDELDRA